MVSYGCWGLRGIGQNDCGELPAWKNSVEKTLKTFNGVGATVLSRVLSYWSDLRNPLPQVEHFMSHVWTQDHIHVIMLLFFFLCEWQLNFN